MITLKQLSILLVILEIFIYLVVNICKGISPENPKALTKAEINKIIKDYPQCASAMYELGIIEPNK